MSPTIPVPNPLPFAPAASATYDKLQQALRDMFMLDKATELDFGIYRIIKQRRTEIDQFLNRDLLPQVQQALTEHLSTDSQALRKELADVEASVRGLGYDPDTNEKVLTLRTRLGQASDVEGLQNEVFSLLLTFFRRYYDKGDFVSQRRYKRDVYAIPYEGEEVKLYWANHDQYYIKTAEYLKHYQVRVGGESSPLWLVLELVEAQLEQGNNKTQGERVRRFVLHEADPLALDGDTLRVRFRYELREKGAKQSALLDEAVATLLPLLPPAFATLGQPAPGSTGTAKAPAFTLLARHLGEYTARHTFDYFIHKDLHGFLGRELDFFLKSEVLLLDDLLAGQRPTSADLQQRLGRALAVRRVGEQIIGFLAQLEEFQKKLWLKKKLVVETQYCVTLDRVPEALYSAVAANAQQLAAWRELFAIEDIRADTVTVGYQLPLPLAFLKQNSYLPVDTAYFDEDFKAQLVGSFENLDEELDGLLVNSENFQALNLLQARYQGQIKSIYIDPPYNTDAGPIMYKNGYRSSSWMSLIDNRLGLTKQLMQDDDIICVTIDDYQVHELAGLLDQHFGKENQMGTAVIRINPSGRSTVAGFSVSHEYGFFYQKTANATLSGFPRTEKQLDRFTQEDGQYVNWKNFIKDGGAVTYRVARPKQFFPLYVDAKAKTIRIPAITWDKSARQWIIEEQPLANEEELLPIDEKGQERVWSLNHISAQKNFGDLEIRKNKKGETQVFRRHTPSESVLPRTWWDKTSYAAREYGSAELSKMFGKNGVFSFAKSPFAVQDSLWISGLDEGNEDIVLDYFAGSGTTAHAVINLNRDDENGGRRKYILVEMGEYFDTVTKPRVLKAAYSREWKNGKPVGRNGISQALKYVRLESYEDTLNNLELRRPANLQLALDTHAEVRHEYLLRYLLDTESRGSLLSLDWFDNPFAVQLKITRQYEQQPTNVDLVETFNYLLGLVVERSYTLDGFRVVRGRTRALGGSQDEQRVLIVWRNVQAHDHAALLAFLRRCPDNPWRHPVSYLFVNGDHTVPNLAAVADEDGESGGPGQVRLIEAEFRSRLFSEEGTL